MDCVNQQSLQVPERMLGITSSRTLQHHDPHGSLPSCAEWVMSLDVAAATAPDSPRPYHDVYDGDELMQNVDSASCSTFLTTSQSTASFLSGAYGAHHHNSSGSSAFASGRFAPASASWCSLPAAAAAGKTSRGTFAPSACDMLRQPSLENALDALTAVVTRQKAGGSSGGHCRARRSLDVLLDEAGSPGTVSAWWACPVIDSTPEEDVVFEDLDQGL